jgi:putative transposase
MTTPATHRPPPLVAAAPLLQIPAAAIPVPPEPPAVAALVPKRTVAHPGPGRPPRLPSLFQQHTPVLYFLTFCTCPRRPILLRPRLVDALLTYAVRGADECGILVGRYVFMPDHVHLFAQMSSQANLGQWAKGLKRALSEVLISDGIGRPHWQRGVFDHVLRSRESYDQKWEYVRANPVRAGLVMDAQRWPYQGEIHIIMMD